LNIRRDAVAVSSVLLTLAVLIPLPAMLGNAWTVPQTRFDIAGRMWVQNYYAPIGFASLAIIVIGLIVTWAGYIKGVRWTWFVMFLIAWGWAFPVLVLAEFHWRNMLPIAQWPPLALKGRGHQLGFAESVLTLLLMGLALVLPAKTFVLGQRGKREQAPAVQNPARE
jgi:energy-coupling factor transporter transmembrane protein EcfT